MVQDKFTKYRFAFPDLRVFIFGREVTSDIISVSVNQSGGSMERMPSSCTITLNNDYDKFTLTHQDMMIIGAEKQRINSRGSDFAESAPDDSVDAWQDLTLKNYTLTSNFGDPKAADAADPYDLNKRLTAEENDTAKFNQKIDDLKKLEWTGSSNLDLGLNADYYMHKIETINDKMSYSTQINPRQQYDNLIKYEARTVFDYPMQEGDCIFHANDPVRVVFRDPFDSSTWYWMFTGFVDSFTENQGVNSDSTLSLTCTDVLKMARYSLIQINTGLLDGNLDNIFTASITQKQTGSYGFPGFQNIFKGLTIIQVLELLFFGTKSLSNSLDSTAAQQVQEIMSGGEEDVGEYLINHLQMTLEDVTKLMYGYELSQTDDSTFSKVMEFAKANSYSLNKEAVADAIKKRIRSSVDDSFTATLPAISHPKGISFKRRNENIGLNAYFYGEVDDADLLVGTPIDFLSDWNNLIHHKVKSTDLIRMATDDYTADNPYLETFDKYTIDQVISIIGSGGSNGGQDGLYPVGKGFVFYLAPGTLETKFADSVLDKSLGGPGSMHSIFKDRLTYLFDLCERIQFCFYATPRGDVVCEMPFYDYDPDDFYETRPPEFDQSNNDAFNGAQGKNTYDTSNKTLYEYLVDYRSNLDDHLSGVPTTSYFSDSFDFKSHFTIEVPEQSGFSNTSTDEGVLTMFRAAPQTIANLESYNNMDLNKFQWQILRELIPTLGIRVGEDSAWGYIDTLEGASLHSALMLNRTNAEARSVAINTVPKFGLMVNRPLFWRQRNYYGNIVGMTHSITWNSDINTTVNINQVRGWSGETDASTGKPIYRHFGDANRPFNLAEFLKKAQRPGAANKKDKKAGE